MNKQVEQGAGRYMKSNIRKLRNERNLSQTELAKVIGKTQQTVSHMEKDRDRIPIESLIIIADYFGVTTDCVLGIEPEESKKEENKSTVIPDTSGLQKGMEALKTNPAGENKKILYQLILSLLLFSLDDEAAGVQDIRTQHA